MAFSRDQPEKKYVTHLLEDNADELWDIIGVKNGHLYVCGCVTFNFVFAHLTNKQLSNTFLNI